MIRDRVDALRRCMKEHKVHAYLVPGADPHQNDYPPPCWQRRAFISGFTGSAGDVVITGSAAGLWTDSRYYLQAEDELDLDVYTLFRSGMEGVSAPEEWLGETLKAGQRVGVDPALMTHREHERYERLFLPRGVELRSLKKNLVDAVWTHQPARPMEKVRIHPLRFAGESMADKLARLRKALSARGAAAHLLTLPDAMAWLFNLRGRDIAYSPLFMAYAVITLKQATLYMDEEKLGDEVRLHLSGKVAGKPYEAFWQDLKRVGRYRGKIWVDAGHCSRKVIESLGAAAALHFQDSPVDRFKAVKNPVEIQGFKAAHVRDGVALVRTLKWIEDRVPGGKVTERGVSDQLNYFRGQGDHFQEPSFDGVIGFREHGAVVHYTPSPDRSMTIEGRGILLMDSGGQYLDGTTDVTRTMAVGGESTAEERQLFTRVLQGHIRVARQPFPAGIWPGQLDVLARTSLWEVGLDFGHSVGHGVGAHLNVHENPPAISVRSPRRPGLEAGMVCSIEPGYYREGCFGFRTENLAVVCEAPNPSGDEKAFLRFAPLTLCPIDLRLVEPSLLSRSERDWLNGYHLAVRKSLTPLLEEEVAVWLAHATRQI
jgi:Xaa-Pro aminopeptidase